MREKESRVGRKRENSQNELHLFMQNMLTGNRRCRIVLAIIKSSSNDLQVQRVQHSELVSQSIKIIYINIKLIAAQRVTWKMVKRMVVMNR